MRKAISTLVLIIIVGIIIFNHFKPDKLDIVIEGNTFDFAEEDVATIFVDCKESIVIENNVFSNPPQAVLSD